MRPVPNQEIAGMLRGISEYLRMDNIPFKPQAYDRAALHVEDLDKELYEIYEAGGLKALKAIPGIGQSIAEHIEEIFKTGKSAYYESLQKKAPVDVAELTRVEGLGPKSIQRLYQELDVRSLDDLEKAAKAGKIRELKGFGPKAEEKILKGIDFARGANQRFQWNTAREQVEKIERRLKEVPGAEKVVAAGSYRRRKETVGDVDILVVSTKPEEVTKTFVKMPGVVRVLAEGETRSSVRLGMGLQVDLRVVPPASYGAALNYFTGSKEHNVVLRQMAIKHGWKLNEYGLFKGEKQIAGSTEEEIYAKLGLSFVPPELRENTGEVQAALKGSLPKLVGYDDIKGDLQVQTDWTDGHASVLGMAEAAHARGLEYIVITDHTKRLAMTGGLDEKRLLEQMAEIDQVNKKLKGKIRVLKGTECDILRDGSLDIADEVLARLDVVGISVHSHFNLPKEEQTARVLKAMRNPHADILFHPTGRLIGKRSPIELDMEAVVRTAKEVGMVLEVNSFPDRLDLKDDYVRMAVAAGVKLAIDSDAHAPNHFGLLPNGIAQARRGWAEKKDVINAWPAEKMLSFLKNKKRTRGPANGSFVSEA